MSVLLHIIGQRKVDKARLSVKGREISLYSMMGGWQSPAAEKKMWNGAIVVGTCGKYTCYDTYNLILKLFYTYE